MIAAPLRVWIDSADVSVEHTTWWTFECCDGLSEYIRVDLAKDACPIGLDGMPELCSAGTCATCMDHRIQALQADNARLREAMKLALDQYMGCGGNLSPSEIVSSMKVVLRTTLEGTDNDG